jgi:hypothetical protein
MRELLGVKPKSAIKVKAVFRRPRYDPGIRVLGAVPSRPDRLSVGRRQSAYVGTRKMVNYA